MPHLVTTAVATITTVKGIRVYTKAATGIVTEACNDTPDINPPKDGKDAASAVWYKGDLKVQANVDSALAAAAWKDWGISVFYQTDDGAIHETRHGLDGWKETEFVESKGALGTKLAVVVNEEGTKAVMFFQDFAGDIRYKTSKTGKSSWNASQILTRAAMGTGIAAVSWNNLADIRVYFQNTDLKIIEYNGSSSGGWKKFANELTCDAITSLAAVAWGPDTDHKEYRIYYQTQNNKIREWSFSPNKGYLSSQDVLHGFSDSTVDIAAFVRGSVTKPDIYAFWVTKGHVIFQRVWSTGDWGKIVGNTIPRTYKK